MAAAGVMLVCAGCGSTPKQPSVSPPAEVDAALPSSLARARAAVVPGVRARAYLEALQALHPGGDSNLVAEIVAALRTERLATALTPSDRFRVDAVALELALADGGRAEIEALVAGLNPVEDSQRRQADTLRARALADADDPRAAVLPLLAVIDRLDDNAGGDLSAYVAAAWRHLSRLPVPMLRRTARSAGSASAKLWMDLAVATNAALTSQGQAAIWWRFHAEHPDHVAARFPPPNVLGVAVRRNVAVLLPLSGDLAQLAEAIRDGFLAAYLEAWGEERDRQTVRFYDTGALSAADAYRQAVLDGADIVVGPLAKSAVAELAALPPERPVVALNNLDDPEPSRDGNGLPSMLQLALAPEDDAAAIAAALTASDVQRVVVFANAAPWSTRAQRRFEKELVAQAGAEADPIEVVAVGALADNSEATAVVGGLLGVAASQARQVALVEMLRIELEFVPRHRDDVDAVVAFVDGRQLMALKPALDFHLAADLPADLLLYAPSQAVRGVAWGRLEGLRVCNIPWLLHGGPLRRETAALATSRGSLASLFALGVDGFRVANQLERMTIHSQSVAGSTGILTADGNGRIHRQLAWGRVSNGVLMAALGP